MKKRFIAIVCAVAVCMTAVIAVPSVSFAATHTHKYVDSIIREPSSTASGLMRHTCSCGNSYVTIYTKESKPQVEPAKPAPTTPTEPPQIKPAETKPAPVKLTKEQKQTKARQGAVDWAIKIANDNDFHYGKQKWAHHNGCYFCGTNQKKGSLKRKAGASVKECEKTYCCNPFVTAAFKHGAGASEVDCKVSGKRINLANDSNPALNNKKAFTRVSKPNKITSLKPGDVLLTPTHAMMYAGSGKVVEAAHHDNGSRGSYWNDSIRCKKISSNQWKRTTKIYRYIGTGRY